MKKSTAAVIVSALVAALGGTTAFAVGQSDQSRYQNSADAASGKVYDQSSICGYCEEHGLCYTDADNDGICDYCTRSTDGAASNCRRGYSASRDSSGSSHHYESSGACDGSGYHQAASASRSGHHTGHGCGHR